MLALIALLGAGLRVEYAGSATSTVTLQPLAPVADAYVDGSAPKKRFGTASVLNTGSAPVRWSYLRFDIRGVAGPVTRATLSLEASGASSAGFQARRVTQSTWDERTITYSAAPALGTVLGTLSPSSAGRVSIDVTPVVQGNGLVDVALSSTAPTGPAFASRETGARGPRLTVSYETTTAPAVTLTQPAGGTATNDSTPTFSGAAGTASSDSSTVTLRVHPGPDTLSPPIQTLTATRSGATWAVDASAPLADGTYTARAEQRDSSGDSGTSSANSFRVDTAAPSLEITAPAAGSTATTGRPAFTGVAGAATGDSPSVGVDVYPGSAASGTPVQRLTATRSGTGWTVTPATALADGIYTARATQGDSAGNQGSSAEVTFTVAAPAGGTAYRSSVIADSPAGYWRLGENAGASAVNQTGTVAGTYLGGVALGRPGGITGDPDTAAGFDGIDDTIRIPHAAAPGSASGLTLEALVRPGTATGTTSTIFRKNLQYLLRTTADGALVFRLWKSGTAREVGTSAGVLVPGRWSHVAATYDGATARIYVDGTLRGSGAVAAPVDLASDDLYIGASTNYDWFSGTLDELAVYTTALSAARLQAHLAAAAFPDGAAPSVLLQTPKAGSRWPAAVAYGGSGGTDPGDVPSVTVELYAGSQASGTPYRTITAALRTTGVFSAEDASPLPSGTYTAVARQRDASGNIATSTAATFVVDAAAPPRVLAAGDIAGCDQSAQAAATGALLDGLGGTVLPLGDNAYANGTQVEFDNCYDPTWGRQRARSRPVPGNHEYANGGTGAEPYFAFFGTAAGDPAKGYYSYDLGNWHLIALNGMCSKVGGCGIGSPQERWLRADLAAHPAACTLAYWHNARFSSGSVHGSDATFTAFWQALYDYDAEVVLNGHEHVYERFAPQTPAGVADPARGIREFVIGTGGYYQYGFGKLAGNSEVRDASSLGVLELTLRDGAYDWRFVPQVGRTFTDSGSTSCH